MQLPQFLRRWITERSATETWLPMTTGASSINDRNLLHANREWVFVAVDKIGSSMRSVRFKVMRYARNGDDQEVFDGPLVDFLEKPARNFTAKDFIYLTTVYKELTGNAFWENTGGFQLKPLIPTQVTAIASKGEIVSYKYSEDGAERAISPRNMLHDRYIDPAKPYWGKGKLQRISRWVDTSSYLTEFMSRFFTNGATFGGFIETEEESEERIKLIKMGLMNDHVGVEKAHKIGVLPKGSKFAKVTANMEEMQMGESDDRYRDKILAAFGIPKSILGLVEDVNRANAEASEYVYAKYTIQPIADDFIEFLNNRVAPYLDPSGKMYFAYDDFIPVDKEAELKRQEIALNGQQYMTVNEARASQGLPPVKGGDVVYGDPYLLPLGTPAPAPEADPDGDDDDAPTKAMPERARRAFRRENAFDGVVKTIQNALEAKKKDLTSPQEELDAISHKKFVSRVVSYRESIAARVRDFNSRQQRDVMLNLRSATKAVDKDALFDMPTEVGVLVDFITPLLQGLMLEQATEEYLAQNLPGTLDTTKPTISKTVQAAARRLARSYNKTTARLLVKTLEEGISRGEDLTKLGYRVNQVYDFSDTTRANAVAHTEAFYIANAGSKEAYKQSGIVQTIRWYTAEDERVCEFCGPLNGKVIDIDDNFFPKGFELTGVEGGKLPLTYRAIDVPPLHTNCRCFIRPEGIAI
jgi:HK97 family phage portal protein